jgi:hypothetical protein
LAAASFNRLLATDCQDGSGSARNANGNGNFDAALQRIAACFLLAVGAIDYGIGARLLMRRNNSSPDRN